MVRTKGRKREQLLELLKRKIPATLLSSIPHRWWIIGEILIIPIPSQYENYKIAIGEAVLELEGKKIRTVLGKMGSTEGVLRVPNFQYLAGGTNTETIHKELGCLFKLDVAKLTFSAGNHGERKRLLSLVHDHEFVIDMFSCVGNLSLPLAVHKNPKQIIAVEINPYAFHYLEENITLNRVEKKMKALLGDNRLVLRGYEGIADRVISGYLHAEDGHISQAIRLCKKGGCLHYHEATPMKKNIENRPIARIERIAEYLGREINVLNKKRVKKYSPGIEHIVVDVIIS